MPIPMARSGTACTPHWRRWKCGCARVRSSEPRGDGRRRSPPSAERHWSFVAAWPMRESTGCWSPEPRRRQLSAPPDLWQADDNPRGEAMGRRIGPRYALGAVCLAALAACVVNLSFDMDQAGLSLTSPGAGSTSQSTVVDLGSYSDVRD